MNLLLDLQAFVWWSEQPRKLSPAAFAEISNPANKVFLSLASLWELQIKIQLNKFKFNDSLEAVVTEQLNTNGFQFLPIYFSHILELGNLPFHHKDPFDRILIAQANVENMILVSADAKLSAYLVNLLW